ncbi:LPS export ABC transporter permease LptG [Alloalcanivorax marinus]|uniref:LPS export ABC transporter permease LptG n=1 Tax=Alloalcanivorax marinus TaxID=1177169 RepID=UPI00195A095F|nr:LPS export ABC transporter permease LptG [Alloalcanivorax marinus]MBM7332538.1 LPS export ABC transporter permease LptG [Alloalcanivorax marinus]
MKLLNRYFWRAVLIPSVAIVAIIVALDCLFGFIYELEFLRGDYQILQALQFILTTVPRRVHEYLPMAILLGTLIGLGLMANNGELSVIRAAGLSTLRVSAMVLRPVIFLMVISLLIGEYLAPYSEQVAQSNRSLQEGGGEALRSDYGFWHREGDEFIHINTVQPNGVLYGLTRYRFTDNHTLAESQFVERALYQGDHWSLEHIQGTRFTDGGTDTYTERGGEWRTSLTPQLLSVVVLEPGRLAMSKLWSYSAYLKKQGLETADYMLAFWQKLLMPAATIGMVLIAISFVFGPLREVTMGLRMAAGIVAGLTFHYGQQFFGHLSLVFHTDPLIAAALPPALCVIVGIWLLARVR